MTRLELRDDIGGKIASRHGGFAARLAGRHALARARASAAPMTHHAARRSSLILHLRSTLSVAPRFDLSLTIAGILREAARPAAETVPPARIAAVAATIRERAASSRALEAPRRALLARSDAFRTPPVAREMRLSTVRETVFRTRTVGAPAPGGHPAAPPDARAVHRDAPSAGGRRDFAVAALPRAMARPDAQPLAAAIGRLEAAVDKLAGGARQEALRSAAESVAPMPPVDPRRIADEVLRTLDHRVVAMRERMGRR
ncbi:hypothetical protein [Methylobacterium frigidaeris]|uniref:Uncharacterized protein n=1 Tax=Methylobacterium frigidaeris TaxID=2038277 RepID=A0AA37HEY0_9HYPH|nr:hypothetical protein [Methylobacterium frigidaeris]GJD64339.1 hypothetical protein MPEAHAMD_4520 [Methylobacterium frigidaeris]